MNNWNTFKLSEISTLIKDGTHGTHKDAESGPYLLSAQNIENGNIFIGESDRKISKSDFDTIHRGYKLQDDDILITIVGSLGRCAILKNYNDDFTFQRSVAIVRFYKTKILPKYAYYQFQTSLFQKELLRRENKGAQGGVYLGELAKIKMFVPDLETQQKVVQILDTINAEIVLIKNLILLEKKAFSSLLQIISKIPNSSLCQLGGIAMIKKGVQLNKENLLTHGIPVINGGIEPSGFTSDSNTEANAITISEGGNSCGFVNFQIEPFWLGGHCYTITPNEINKKLLYFILKGNERRIKRLRVGSGLPNIQKEDLKKIKISIPPFNKHENIVALLGAVENRINALNKLIKKEQSIYKYLLNHLISGDLDVSNIKLEKGKEQK